MLASVFCFLTTFLNVIIAQNLEPLKDLGVLEGTKIFVWDGSQVIVFVLIKISIFIFFFYLHFFSSLKFKNASFVNLEYFFK